MKLPSGRLCSAASTRTRTRVSPVAPLTLALTLALTLSLTLTQALSLALSLALTLTLSLTLTLTLSLTLSLPLSLSLSLALSLALTPTRRGAATGTEPACARGRQATGARCAERRRPR